MFSLTFAKSIAIGLVLPKNQSRNQAWVVRKRVVWSKEGSIGPSLKRLREKNGMTTRELAEKIDCSHSRIVKIENGGQRIALDEFIVWCFSMDVSPSVFIDKLIRGQNS
jgi:DNA-binding XRE family transcriptional regulator